MESVYDNPPTYLIGRKHTFPDGNSIEVTQLKRREDGYWVTYLIRLGPGQPKQLVMPIPEFIEQYSHLFTSD